MKYVFPFRYIPRDSRIAIYGAGRVGQEYLWQVRETQYANVVCMVDVQPEEYRELDIHVICPSELIRQKVDYVVIAMASENMANDVKKNLAEMGISPTQIVFKRLRPTDPSIVRSPKSIVAEDTLAFCKKECIPMAVRIGGGFGDLIVCKRLIEELLAWDDDLRVDVFVAPHQVQFMENLLAGSPKIGRVVGNMDQFRALQDRYVAAFSFGIDLDVEACHTERILEKKQLCSLLEAIKDADTAYGHKLYGMLAYVHYGRCKKDGLSRYTAYNRYPGFRVTDYRTKVPLDHAAGVRFQEDFQSVPRYITINYGWDMPEGRPSSQPQAKVWPFAYWKQLVQQLKEAWPDVAIVQTGAKGFPHVPGCDRYEQGHDWNYVKWLLKESLLHIDIEGGLVHLATQLGTKCIVLFGPSPMQYYAYPDNINLRAGTCHDCYCLDGDFFSCYLRQEQPECMRAITPEMVAKAAQRYFESIENGQER